MAAFLLPSRTWPASRRALLGFTAASLVLLGGKAVMAAEAYPSKPVKVIVPFAAGVEVTRSPG